MRGDLDRDRERKWMTKQWAKRDGELLAVLEATSGLYGDLGLVRRPAGHRRPEPEGDRCAGRIGSILSSKQSSRAFTLSHAHAPPARRRGVRIAAISNTQARSRKPGYGGDLGGMG